MQTAPYNYNSIYEEGNYEVQYKVNIDGVDYGQNMIWSMKTSRKLFSEDKPMIGCAMVGQIDLTLTSPGVTFSRMAKIKPYIRLYSKTRRIYSGWLQKGEYFVDTRPADQSDGIETLEITGYDAMRKANRKYPSSTLAWTATSPYAYYVVNEICGFLGISMDSRTRALLTSTLDTDHVVGFPAQYTIAEVLGSIAAMYGGNFCISDTGTLLLVGLMDLPKETYLLINERGDYLTFGGIRIKLSTHVEDDEDEDIEIVDP